MKKGKAKPKSYALRIEAHLVEPLQKLKKHNRRSLNAEINAALERWVAGATRATAKESPADRAESKPKASTPTKHKVPVSAATTRSDPGVNGKSG